MTQKPDQLSQWQQKAMAIPEQYDLFLGGGRGGGKSHLLASLFLRHCEQFGQDAKCLVVRKSFPGLQDIENDFRNYFTAVYGNAIKIDTQKHRFTLPSGAYIQLDQLERESDFNKYQGKSYTHIAIDEAGQYSSPTMIDKLRSSLRARKGIPLRFIILANPGGLGHAWIVKRHAGQANWQPYTEESTQFDFVTVSSTYKDNDFIDQELYAKNLKASCATDPELAKAWLDGDWSVLRGAYFANVIDEHKIRIEPWAFIPGIDLKSIKSNVKGYRTTAGQQQNKWSAFLAHDFGIAAPSVTYLCLRSPGDHGADGVYYPRNSIILLDEETTTHPEDLNTGLGLTVPDQALRIKEMCNKWQVSPNGIADDAIFNKTGSSVGSIADEFRKAGVYFNKAKKGSRIAGWQTMRRLLANAGQPDQPGLYVSRNCRIWWQTVPSLPRDPRNPEDVDSASADHAADACRYALTNQIELPHVNFKFI